MSKLNLKDFMRKYNLKDDPNNETGSQRVCNYPISPRDSKILSDRGFINIDNGERQGVQWTCFIVKDNKSHYFDKFGGQPDKLLLNEIRKPTIYINHEIQDIDSNLCVSYCSYFL